MNFTFNELKLIDQAVKMWKEKSEEVYEGLTEGSSFEEIYSKQIKELTSLLDKIENTPL